jgi:hypothetical protein
MEMEKSNNDDTIIWCKLDDGKQIDLVNNLVKELNKHKKIARRNTLFELFGTNYLLYGYETINLEFFHHFESLFYKDSTCLCNLTVNDKYGNNIFYKGKQLGSGKVGIAYIICFKEKDKSDNCLQVLKTMPHVKLNYEMNSTAIMTHNNVNNHNKVIYKNGYDKHVLYFGSGAFINQTCIHMTLNNILKNTTPNYLYQYDAFFCGTKSKLNIDCNITDICYFGDLNSFINLENIVITNDFLKNMIKQLFTTLFRLKNVRNQFTHSDLKPKNVFVSGTIENPIYKLADFDKSSIFHNKIRFYNNTMEYNNIEPSISSLLQKIDIDLLNFFVSDERFFHFKLNKNMDLGNYNIKENESALIICNLYLQKLSMHNVLPFVKSYDYYTFMFGILLEKKVNSFFKIEQNRINSYFWNLWRAMWETDDDFIKVNNLINFAVSLTVSNTLNQEKKEENIIMINKDYPNFSVFYRNFLEIYKYPVNNRENVEIKNNSNSSNSESSLGSFISSSYNALWNTPSYLFSSFVNNITTSNYLSKKLDITSLDFIKKCIIKLECDMYIDLHYDSDFKNILFEGEEYNEEMDIDIKDITKLDYDKDSVFKDRTKLDNKKNSLLGRFGGLSLY